MSAVVDFFYLCIPESLRYLSMYDNRCLRYFKGHKQRFECVILIYEFSTLQKHFSLVSIHCRQKHYLFFIVLSFPFCFGAFLSLIVGPRSLFLCKFTQLEVFLPTRIMIFNFSDINGNY